MDKESTSHGSPGAHRNIEMFPGVGVVYTKPLAVGFRS